MLTVSVQSRKITDLFTVRSYRHDKKSSVWFANGSYKLHNLKTKAKWRVKWMTHRDTQQTFFLKITFLTPPVGDTTPPPPGGGGGNSNKKMTGMLVVRVRGVNFGFSVSLSMLWVKFSVSHSVLRVSQDSLGSSREEIYFEYFGIYHGLNELSLSHTPRLVSFRGSVQNFRYHFVCFIWESPFPHSSE